MGRSRPARCSHGQDRSSLSTALPKRWSGSVSAPTANLAQCWAKHWPKIMGRATAATAWWTQRRPARTLSQALDGDEFVTRAGAGGRRHGTRDLLALDLAEGGDLDVIVGLAIGGGNHHPAARAGRQTAVDAIAVGIVADDEYPRFGLRRPAESTARDDERGEKIPHRCAPHSRLSGRSKRNTDLAWERLKAPLTEPPSPRRT